MSKKGQLLKKLKKSKVMREAQTIDYAEDGRAQINVGLRTTNDFFSPYSYLTYELMNPAVSDYIDSFEAVIPESDEISIDIYTEEMAENDEKKRIRTAVKRHHAEEIVNIEKKLKRKTISGVLWSVLGILILLVEAILFGIFENMYLDTILAVVGWLFLWDGMEILLSDRGHLKRKLYRSYRLMNAKVHVRMYSKKIQREYSIGEFEEDDEDE